MLFTQSTNAAAFVTPQWILTPLSTDPQKGPYLLVLSGIVATNFEAIQHTGWRSDTLQIQPDVDIKNALSFANAPKAPPGSRTMFEVQQYSTFGSLSSIFDESEAVNAGFSINSFWPFFEPGSRRLVGVNMTIAVQDRDASLLRVGYQITAVGTFTQVANPDPPQ